ncbi:MAG: hypothetical protein AB1679_12175 [Actinomycetota bacterium]
MANEDWDKVLKSNPSLQERWEARIRGDHSEVIPTAKADEEPAPVAYIHAPDELTSLAAEIRKSQPGLTREQSLLRALEISPEAGLKRGRVERAEEVVKEFRAAVSTRRLFKSNQPAVLKEAAQLICEAHLGKLKPVVKSGEDQHAYLKDRPDVYAKQHVMDILKSSGFTPDDCQRANTMALVALGILPADEDLLARCDDPEITLADLRQASSGTWLEVS